jgi:hypothetical protein
VNNQAKKNRTRPPIKTVTTNASPICIENKKTITPLYEPKIEKTAMKAGKRKIIPRTAPIRKLTPSIKH